MAEFIVSGTVHGTWFQIIEADTEEQAREKMNAIVESDDYIGEIDEVTDVSIDDVRKLKPQPKILDKF